MAAPLGLEPLLPRPGESLRKDLARRAKETLRRGLVLCATTAALYGVNTVLTGELQLPGR